MKIISCSLQNFASYKSLEFNFENQGLTLVQGATGSGKSTLCDAIPWCLFGTTAKNGAVDEVLSWPGDQITKGELTMEIYPGTTSKITRIRGGKANDLYIEDTITWTEPRRGKDLQDTQKLINHRLGIDSALYLSGAYFHEFSQTAQFFTTTAKNRRIICEQLVDLSLAKDLQATLAEQKKELHNIQQTNASDIRLYGDRIQNLAKPNDYQKRSDNFEDNKLKAITALSIQIDAIKIKPDAYFTEANRELQQAEKALGTDRCSECGAKKHSDQHTKLEAMFSDLRREVRENDYKKEKLENLNVDLQRIGASENPYGDMLLRVKADLKKAESQLEITQELQHNNTIALSDLELLLEVVNDLRGITIKNTINSLEQQTNKLLTDHFDAEIRVQFEVADADKLDVTITKDGNICSFSQLSKGQRQILKLCFAVSVMRTVANRHGLSFNCAFFDEALDGMDDNFKVKAFGLLQTVALEYTSVFVVEHNEALKSMFTNKYTVELVNGSSVINGC